MSPFTGKDWRNATTHEGGGDTSTPISAAALEDLETRLSDYTDEIATERGVNVKDYGAVGDGSTSDTAAFNSAIAVIEADTTNRPPLYLPPGNYMVGDLDTIDFGGFTVIGAKREGFDNSWTDDQSSQITHTGSGVLFNLSTFDSTPSNLWVGTTQGACFENLVLHNENDWAIGDENSRTRTAIKDNGGGELTVRNCRITGFQYGIASPYGGDYNFYERLAIHQCDVGIYLGPGSQQDHLQAVAFANCREGFVGDCAAQGRMESCWFTDSSVVDAQFEYLSTTRFGLAADISGSFNDLGWVLESCWHESGADAVPNRKPSNGHIRTYTNTASTSYPRGVRVRDPFLVAGGSGGSNRSFWECHDGRYLTLENLMVQGDQVAYAMNRDTNASRLTQKGLRTADGYTAVVPFRNENVNCRYLVEGQSVDGLKDVASAATATMPADCDRVHITGTTNISRITPSYAGRVITLLFAGSLTLPWAGGGGDNLYFNGSANFSATANDSVTLMAYGNDWYEIGRAVI